MREERANEGEEVMREGRREELRGCKERVLESRGNKKGREEELSERGMEGWKGYEVRMCKCV